MLMLIFDSCVFYVKIHTYGLCGKMYSLLFEAFGRSEDRSGSFYVELPLIYALIGLPKNQICNRYFFVIKYCLKYMYNIVCGSSQNVHPTGTNLPKKAPRMHGEN